MNTSIPLHDFLGFEFDVPEPGSSVAEVHMAVTPAALGFTGNLHGGAIAALVDMACGLVAALASGVDLSKESLVTADMHLRYLGRPTTDRVTARAEIVKMGSQLIVIDCDVLDGEGHRITACDYSMMRVPRRDPLAVSTQG